MAKTLLSMHDCGGGRWQNSDSKTAVITLRTSQSIASRMRSLKIIGPYVWCPQALLMPTPRRDYDLMAD